ncbi:hypothetical protein LY76DRAFT_672663 [Colletotrichum caudatum]|nr:hypothetical protein LY76DRAFT_672663 [Colletotrichum caudatum]
MRPCILQPLALCLWCLLLAGAAAHPLEDRSYKEKFDNVFYVKQGEWACSRLKLERIRLGIQEAQRLAGTSINMLATRGSETSPAFNLWFGKSNATPQMVDALIKQHYRTALSHLSAPTIPTQFYFSKVPNFRAIKGKLKPTSNSIVYACPPDNDPAKMCGPGNSAVTVYEERKQVQGGGGSASRGPTILGFCPAYFEHGVFASNIDMVDKYRRYGKTDKPSRGFLLMHELQRLSKATFPDPPAQDVDAPSPALSSNGKCYSAECCAKLPDSGKIRNARNYALFSLYVAAFPSANRAQAL